MTTHSYTAKCEYELRPIEYEVIKAERPFDGWYQLWTGGERWGRFYETEDDAHRGAPESIQFLVNFWAEQLRGRQNAWVIDGLHYRTRPDLLPTQSRNLAGFSGQEFRLRAFGSNEVIITHNLWTQGRVPDWFRAHFPDNGEFVYPIFGTSPLKYTSDREVSEQSRRIG